MFLCDIPMIQRGIDMILITTRLKLNILPLRGETFKITIVYIGCIFIRNFKKMIHSNQNI